MHTALVVIHLFLSIGLIGLILIQHGKGADAGAAFGSGASGTVFGARGAANFLSRTTAVLATLFFITSLALGWMVMKEAREAGIMVSAPDAKEIPAPKVENDLPPRSDQKVKEGDLPTIPEGASKTGEGAQVTKSEGGKGSK